MVLAGRRMYVACRRVDSEVSGVSPRTPISLAFLLVDGLSVSVRTSAHVSINCVLAVRGEVVTPVRVTGEHGSVSPHGRIPVWVVVALFRALESVSVTVGILSRSSCVLPVQGLIGSEQSFVSLGVHAKLVVELETLVLSVLGVVLGIFADSVGSVVVVVVELGAKIRRVIVSVIPSAFVVPPDGYPSRKFGKVSSQAY